MKKPSLIRPGKQIQQLYATIRHCQAARKAEQLKEYSTRIIKQLDQKSQAQVEQQSKARKKSCDHHASDVTGNTRHKRDKTLGPGEILPLTTSAKACTTRANGCTANPKKTRVQPTPGHLQIQYDMIGLYHGILSLKPRCSSTPVSKFIIPPPQIHICPLGVTIALCPYLPLGEFLGATCFHCSFSMSKHCLRDFDASQAEGGRYPAFPKLDFSQPKTT